MIELRPVQFGDLDKCRELRNKNRKWFGDDGIISESRHIAWYKSIKDNFSFYVIELEGVVIGTISANEENGAIEIGNLTLDENYRGHGYMTKAAQKLIRPDGVYVGRTLPENINSQKVFERLGFVRQKELAGDYVLFRLYT
jgi:RimJ/RimL family protein N-acetyltransferase